MTVVVDNFLWASGNYCLRPFYRGEGTNFLHVLNYCTLKLSIIVKNFACYLLHQGIPAKRKKSHSEFGEEVYLYVSI